MKCVIEYKSSFATSWCTASSLSNFYMKGINKSGIRKMKFNKFEDVYSIFTERVNQQKRILHIEINREIKFEQKLEGERGKMMILPGAM